MSQRPGVPGGTPHTGVGRPCLRRSQDVCNIQYTPVRPSSQHTGPHTSQYQLLSPLAGVTSDQVPMLSMGALQAPTDSQQQLPPSSGRSSLLLMITQPLSPPPATHTHSMAASLQPLVHARSLSSISRLGTAHAMSARGLENVDMVVPHSCVMLFPGQLPTLTTQDDSIKILCSAIHQATECGHHSLASKLVDVLGQLYQH
jgi:hypothetical protein